MSIENRSAYENITTDPENILQMQPVSCDFGRFANAGECRAEVIEKPVPNYTISSNKTSVNEGESITFTIVGINTIAGVNIPYTITGISAADLLTGSLTGNFVLDSNLQNSITVSLKNDTLTEGSETMRLTVTGSFVNVLVNDTSLSPSYYVYYGNGLEDYTSESQITQFTSKATTNKNGSYSFPEGAETDDVVYKWIFIQTNLGAVSDLNSFKVGTFSANMKLVGTIGNFYAYRTNNMSFGAVTITLG